MKKYRLHKGFTLIELLIVIAIIAILASIIVVSYANAQTKARDNKRRADIQSIASALQVYHADKKTWYIPGSGAGTNGLGIGYYSSVYAPSISIHDALEQSGYLNPAPRDPKYRKYLTNCINTLGTTPGTCYLDYMVYTCGSGTSATAVSVSAVTEIHDQSEITETSKSCNGSAVAAPGNSVDLRYGNTYSVTVR